MYNNPKEIPFKERKEYEKGMALCMYNFFRLELPSIKIVDIFLSRINMTASFILSKDTSNESVEKLCNRASSIWLGLEVDVRKEK